MMKKTQIGYRYSIIENGVKLSGIVIEIDGDDVSVRWSDGEITKESLRQLEKKHNVKESPLSSLEPCPLCSDDFSPVYVCKHPANPPNIVS